MFIDGDILEVSKVKSLYFKTIEKELSNNKRLITEVEDKIKECIENSLSTYIHINVEKLDSCPERPSLARNLLVYEFRRRGFDVELTLSPNGIKEYVFISWERQTTMV